jgi:hypothetical protein
MKTIQIVSIILVIILVANMILFAMGLVTPMIFWGVIILMGWYAFKFMPKQT